MLGAGERPLSGVAYRAYNRRAIKERQGKPLLIVTRPVVEAIRLLRVTPQGKRPAGAQRVVVHSAKPGVRADTSKPGAGEIDKIEGARRCYICTARFAQGLHVDTILAGDSSQRFDKGAMHIGRGVQHTINALRSFRRVEAAIP